MKIIKHNSSFFEILGRHLKGISLLLFPFNFLIGDAPDWSVNSGDYSSNLSLIGSFYYNEESFDGLNMVGAFDTNGEVRGVATGTVYGTDYLYLITIYGNNAVEEITFKAWIAAEDSVLAVTESIQFVPDGTIGTLVLPEIFNVYSNYDFVPVLSGIPDQSIHMGEEFVDIYLNDYLTVGDDDAIIFSTSQGTNIQVSQSGDQIEFSPIENWIGTEDIIFTATELTNNGYYATDTASFTVLKEDNAPFFSPIPNQIIGSNGTFATVDLLEYLTELDEDSLSFSVSYGLSVDEDEYPDWSVNSLDYEFSMNAVVYVKSRNEVVEGTDHLLGAFDSNGNIRGVTNGVAYGDGWLYLITIYSNTIGDEINFRFYDNSIQRNIPIQESLSFENDGVLGTPSFPITFNSSFVNAQVTPEGLVTFSRTDESWYGTDSLIFEAMDNGTLNNYTDSDTITLTVQGGFAPLLSGIPNQSINVGSSFSPINLSNYLQTFDEDEILWSFSGNVDLNVSLNGSVVNIEVDNSWGGSEDIVFTATDNNAIALASSDTVTFTVIPLDNPPFLSNIPDQAIFIDEEFNSIDLTDYLTELDGDELSWSYRFLSHPSETNNPLWTLVPSNFSYSMNIVAEVEALGEIKETSEHRLAAIDQNGQTVGVAQGSSYQDIWIYNLTIYSNELNPDINLYFYDSDAQRALLVDMDLSFINGQQLGSPLDPYLLRAGPFFLDISQTGVLSFEILQKHWEFAESIRLTVMDKNTDNNYSYFYDVSFMIENRTPSLVLENQTINEGEQFQSIFLDQYISDDGTTYDSLLVNVTADSIYTVELINDTLLTIYPPQNEDWHGAVPVTFSVTDHHPYYPETLNSDVLFIMLPVNDAPVIEQALNQTVSEDELSTFVMEVADVDTGTTFTLSAVTDTNSVHVIPNSDNSTITTFHDAHWHGQSEITVFVSDGELLDTTSFTLIVEPVNDAPIIAQAEDQTIDEDTQGIFSFVVSDIDTGTTLNLSAISDTDAVSIEANSLDFSLTITPEDNWHGQTEITVFVSDGDLLDTTSFALTVLPVNDEPVIASIPDVVIDEDSIFVLTLEITDIDTGEIFTLFPSTNSSSVVVLSNNQDSSITVIPDENWHGTASITIVVSDGELFDSKTFQLIVEPVNDAPLIFDAQNQTILEDNVGLFSFEVSDIDTGSVLTLSALYDTNVLSLVAESENYTIQAYPSQDWHGSTQITAVLSDGLLNDSTSFSLIVSPLNDSPIINDINDQSIPEDGSGIFSFEISDVDTGETLSLTAYSDISSVNVEANSIDTTVTVYGEENWYGESTISVVVSDGELFDTTNFNLSVYPMDSDPPTIMDIEDQTLLEDQNSTFFFDVADIDTGQTLTLSAFSDTSAVNLVTNSESFSVSTLLDTNWHGQAEITVIVSDGFLSDSTSFSLLVEPVNDDPIISSINDTSILENSIFEIMPEITDVDTGEVFSLLASSSDSSVQIEIDQLTLLIRFTPDDNWHGISNILIIASDGELLDTTSFTLTVNPVNDAPVISNMENQNINEDEQGIFGFEISDVDTGETLIVSAYSDTSAVLMQVNLESRNVTAYLDIDWFGSSSISVEVSDGFLADTSSFILTVNPVNDAPTIASVQDTSILEDSTVDISFDVMDVDSFEDLTLEVFSDTNTVSCIVLDGSFIVNIIPDPNWFGQTIIHAVISDGEFSDTTNFQLSVEYVSDQPIAALGDDLICMQGQQMRIDGSNSYDIDNESLSYIWIIENILQDTVRLSNPFLSFEAPVVDTSQSYVVKLQVENENGLLSNIDSILLTVDLIEINDIFSESNQTEVNPGEDIPIEVQFPQYFDVDSISLNYSTAFSGFLSESMETQGSRSGSNYSANIPFHDVGFEGLAYFIYAKDQHGSEIVTDTVDISMRFKPGIISSDMTFSPFQDGFPKDVWRMISIPSYVKSNSISDLFYSQLGSNSSNEKWRIYEYGRFEGNGVWNFPDTLKPGKGYWLKQLVADNPHFTLDSGKTIELTGFDIELLSGWNIISSPYLFPVNVRVDPPYFPQLFVFGDDSLEGWIDSSITRMMPWTAYAAFNSLESRTLRLLPLDEPNRSLSRETGAPGWNVQITAQNGMYIDRISRFGVHSLDKSFGDSLNIPTPPLMNKYVSISSFQNHKGKLLELAHDFRAQSDSIVVWDLKLVSNIKGNDNALTFNVEGQLGNKLLKFVDMQNGSALDLRLENGKTLQLLSYVGSSQYLFKLLYGSQEDVENKLTEILAMIPEEYHLGNNYPNPFNPSTSIPFAISNPGNVYLTIYDLKGREVKRLLRDYLQVGYHSANWDGQNELGISVSSGVYYYELRTSKFRSVKKMVLIK